MPASRSPGLASALLLTLLAAAAAAAAATVPDSGGWSHCTTPDLLHWNCSHPKTGFDGDTGSLTVTPKGTFAMWPTVGKAPPGIEMATPVSSALDEWVHHGVIGVPPNADGGLRDPGRAIQVREASAQCAIDVDDRARAQSAWLTRVPVHVGRCCRPLEQLKSGWYIPAGVGAPASECPPPKSSAGCGTLQSSTPLSLHQSGQHARVLTSAYVYVLVRTRTTATYVARHTWLVGSIAIGGIHWFRADNDSMTHLNHTGFLYTSRTITEMECPVSTADHPTVPYLPKYCLELL